MRIPLKSLSLAVFATLALGATPGAATPEDSLSQLINRELRAGGPFFTADERAMIERKCGYAAGQWDGFDANISNGVFHCRNGRRIDDPELRAMLHAASPRISQRVRAVMANPEIASAIDRIAREATERALRQVRTHRGTH